MHCTALLRIKGAALDSRAEASADVAQKATAARRSEAPKPTQAHFVRKLILGFTPAKRVAPSMSSSWATHVRLQASADTSRAVRDRRRIFELSRIFRHLPRFSARKRRPARCP